MGCLLLFSIPSSSISFMQPWWNGDQKPVRCVAGIGGISWWERRHLLPVKCCPTSANNEHNINIDNNIDNNKTITTEAFLDGNECSSCRSEVLPYLLPTSRIVWQLSKQIGCCLENHEKAPMIFAIKDMSWYKSIIKTINRGRNRRQRDVIFCTMHFTRWVFFFGRWTFYGMYHCITGENQRFLVTRFATIAFVQIFIEFINQLARKWTANLPSLATKDTVEREYCSRLCFALSSFSSTSFSSSFSSSLRCATRLLHGFPGDNLY